MPDTPIERFWKNVDFKKDGCWTWLGSCTSAGYGQLNVNRKPWYAHRYVLYLQGLDIPSTMVVDHICRHRACVNPDHLRITSNQENINAGTGMSARNLVKTHCPKGHPYNEENTWMNKHGVRFCRLCRKEWDERNREQIRASARRRYLQKR